MSKVLSIVVDDDDRDNDPERPYVAILCGPDGNMISDNSGIGATPRAAILDLLNDLSERELP